MVEHHRQCEAAARQKVHDEIGLFPRFVCIGRLREEVRSHRKPCRFGAVEVFGVTRIGVEGSFGVASVAHAHECEIDAIGGNGLPVDRALMLGHVHAQSGAHLAVLDVGQSVGGAFEGCPIVRARVGCGSAFVGGERAASSQDSEKADERSDADDRRRARGGAGEGGCGRAGPRSGPGGSARGRCSFRRSSHGGILAKRWPGARDRPFCPPRLQKSGGSFWRARAQTRRG